MCHKTVFVHYFTFIITFRYLLYFYHRLLFKSTGTNGGVHFRGTGFQAQVHLHPKDWSPPNNLIIENGGPEYD